MSELSDALEKRRERNKKLSEGKKEVDKFLGGEKRITIKKEERESRGAEKNLSKGEFQEYKKAKAQLGKRESRSRLKGLKEEASYLRRRAKYDSTRSGRLGLKISKGLKALSQRGGITRAFYNRGVPEKYQKEIPNISQQRQIRQAQLQRYYQKDEEGFSQADYDNIVNGGDIVAKQLIPEVFNASNGGESSIGDREVFNMENQISRSGSRSIADEGDVASFGLNNFSIPKITSDIDKEVFAHSNFQHRNAVLDVDKIVNFYGGLVNPKKTIPKRRK